MLHCTQCGRSYDPGISLCPEDGSPLKADETVAEPAAEDPLIGRTFDGKYRLDERLGEGGMGAVYRATHLLIDRPVAIKVLHQRFVENEAARERFHREARAAGRLQHSNAVAITDFGTTEDGFVYIVMELLEGHSLRNLLAKEAPLDPARAVSLMLQISAAVAAAHEAGIIHRDLKPGNIFIARRTHAPAIVKVLDFGIAKLAADFEGREGEKLTLTGMMIGTPRYMSPEQCDGGELTPASDVYSLGLILYEMLTGAVPFTGPSALAVALRQTSEEPRPPSETNPSVPAEIEKLILHSLRKRPDDRPQDAGAFRRELYEVAERLGLEHSAGFSIPTMETVRSVGSETPSGRLVLDIAKLREDRASRSTTSFESAAETDPEEPVDTGSSRRESSGQAIEAAPRFEIPLSRSEAIRLWVTKPGVMLALSIALFVAVGILALYATRPSATLGSLGDEDSIGRSLTPKETLPRPPRREPNSAAEFFERGAYYFSRKEYDASIRDYRKAIELQPEFPAAHNRLGRALMMKGQFAGAINQFRTAIQQNGGRYPVAQYNLGFAFQLQGDAQSAAEAYRAAIDQRNGTYPDAYYQLGSLALEAGRLDEAIEGLTTAVKQNSGRDPGAQLKLATAYALKRDFANAEYAFLKAVEQSNGSFPEATKGLAFVYEDTGRSADALRHYERYLAERPNASDRREVERRISRLQKQIETKAGS